MEVKEDTQHAQASTSTQPGTSKSDNSCRVCGDTTTAIHYGVWACQGCKSFFGRSRQSHNTFSCPSKDCIITKVTRNRCMYCRWQKCIAVGMSKECVRLGRRTKNQTLSNNETKPTKAPSAPSTHDGGTNEMPSTREAACSMSTESEIMEQDSTSKSNDDDDPLLQSLVDQVASAYKIFDTKSDVPLQSDPQQLERLGKMYDENVVGTDEERYNTFFEDAAKNIEIVVAFCKALPGFKEITLENQIKILKKGTFEVVAVKTSIFLRNAILNAFKKTPFAALFDEVYRVTLYLRRLELTDIEYGLVCAILIFSSGRPGLLDSEGKIESQQLLFIKALRHELRKSHPAGHEDVFDRIMLFLPFIREVACQHRKAVSEFSPQVGTSRPQLHREMFASVGDADQS